MESKIINPKLMSGTVKNGIYVVFAAAIGLAFDKIEFNLFLLVVALYGIILIFSIKRAIAAWVIRQNNPPVKIINGVEYVLLQNATKSPKSLMESGPDHLVESYKKQGWDVQIYDDAEDVFGNKISDSLSLWGRKN